MDKITFVDDTEPSISADNLKLLQENIDIGKFEKMTYSLNLSAKKWYRIARIDGTQGATGNSFILNINTSFGADTNKSFVIGISIAYNKANIVTLSCTENPSTNVVSAVRVVKDSAGICYLEIFYNLSTTNNVSFEIMSNKNNIAALNFEDTVSGEILIKSHNIRNPYEITTGQETATNEYIDGKQVYIKRVNFGALPNNTTKRVAHNLTSVTFVRFSVSCTNASGYCINLPYVDLGANVCTVPTITNTEIVIKSITDQTIYNAYVDLYYTKN